ncbi:hypothetical protein BDV95DRAFT_303598 [Massariosphaeria phaeospora]|uniref:Uncharacterized protein n=1 Tax=Massariosphaeria phaeospora TaxID=100035 RepID=A0A7C8ICZ8_9PLEO|nr:hypothetical protein BDV95DRAFT_303598 [Massariosphaeria phaeospora]
MSCADESRADAVSRHGELGTSSANGEHNDEHKQKAQAARVIQRNYRGHRERRSGLPAVSVI